MKKELTHEVADLHQLLKSASKDIGNKKSWVGKNATKWHTDIEGQRRTLKRLIDELIPSVQKEIDKCPEKVSPQEAKLMNNDMQRY
ncbi:hypothetical protein OHA44_24125 [Streptomyces sp. NBC_00144]|uniref:hypothetical protein n=1 Tax=unclassified Streptomyces TaxID=2593676 RepID=UPI003246450C